MERQCARDVRETTEPVARGPTVSLWGVRPREEESLRVLFVCTANISRSPYAERRSAQMLAGLNGDPVELGSAGIPGVVGRGMDPEMAAQLRARGAEPNGHVSRALTLDLLETTSLVLTFEFAHRVRITEFWPEHAIKVFGLHQFADALTRVPSRARGLELLDQAYGARRPDGLQADVADPYRRGATAARVCADEIDAALSVIVPALAGTFVDGGAARS